MHYKRNFDNGNSFQNVKECLPGKYPCVTFVVRPMDKSCFNSTQWCTKNVQYCQTATGGLVLAKITVGRKSQSQ